MSSLVARQSIRIPLLWSDADELGDFVDYLYELIQPEIEAEAEDMPHDFMKESLRERATPHWWLSLRRDRRLNVDGPYRDIKHDVDLSRARRLNITVGSHSGTRFEIEVDFWGADLTISAPSETWLDNYLPAIKERARTLTPRWGRLYSKRIYSGLFFAGWVGSILLAIRPRDASTDWLTWVTFALFIVGVAGTALPILRLGPRPRPVWLRVLAWVVSTLVVAVIGAVVSRLLYPA